MSDDEKEDGPAIYTVETIPPPDGEDDAYSAPTKVGPMADAAVRELMQAAERKAAELSARLAEKKAASAAAAKVASSLPTPISVKPTGVPQTPASSKPPATAPASSPAPSSGSGSGSGSGAAAASSTAPPSPQPAPTGPVSGRSPAPPVGPVGRSLPSAAPMSPKPPSMVPRPAAIPRVDAVIATPAPIPAPPPPPPPALPVMTMEPAALAALAAEPLPPAASPSESAPHTPPRLYDEKDETEDAATLLHKPAAPPRQEHTALLPSAVAPHKPTTQPREPIPFDRAIAAPVREPEPPGVLLMPLVVGFLIFAIGLGFYIWARRGDPEPARVSRIERELQSSCLRIRR